MQHREQALVMSVVDQGLLAVRAKSAAPRLRIHPNTSVLFVKHVLAQCKVRLSCTSSRTLIAFMNSA
jgi:hypothetical protein